MQLVGLERFLRAKGIHEQNAEYTRSSYLHARIGRFVRLYEFLMKPGD